MGKKEEIKVVYGFDFVHVAVFRGQKIDLEERLSIREYIVGGLPVLLVFLGGLIGACSASWVLRSIIIICGRKSRL